MKLIKILRKWKTFIRTKLQDEVYYKSFISLTGLSVFAIAIWCIGPYIKWDDHSILIQPEKRIYVILVIFLIWLLKFLIMDLAVPSPSTYTDEKIRKKLFELQSRFQGALNFLNSKKITTKNKSISLNKLPWYLLIGPIHAGKTTLLANSDIRFILQKQFQDLIPPSENCDWWVTKNATIIDIPGNYLSGEDGIRPPHLTANTILWKYFINLLKNKCGKNAVKGVIITLPAPEIIKQSETKYFHALLKDIFTRIHEIQKIIKKTIPCQLIITKCDLIPGFKEFFTESSKEELMQVFGITLPAIKEKQKIMELCNAKFNAIIKRINQQLLHRIHQERNPMLRHNIKDFPLQIERIKEFILDFTKRFLTSGINATIYGIHLTSAIQPEIKLEKNTIIQSPNHSERSVKIFKEPAQVSQPYFIKNLLTFGIIPPVAKKSSLFKKRSLSQKIAYALSISSVIIVGSFLTRNFIQGINQTYAITQNINDYKIKLLVTQDPRERLIDTIQLLNYMQQFDNSLHVKFSLSYLLTFYSHKSEQKTQEVYQQALHTVLPQEIKNYFEDFLLLPINKDTDDIYAALKAYLMMGDVTYFDSQYVSRILLKILPESISKSIKDDLILHLETSLKTPWHNVMLNERIIYETRNYLMAQPELKLSYIILKNIDNNNIINKINLGENSTYNSIFIDTDSNRIPMMFTSNSFASIISQEAILAAQEATSGNWVLGRSNKLEINPIITAALIDQLRLTYVNNYINAWEHFISNIHLNKPTNLSEIDAMIVNIISDHSPLIQLLKMLYTNTYFEPIISSSPKLKNLGLLIDKSDTSQNLLYEIFSSLQSLHRYLQVIINAKNTGKAAFDAVSSRMLGRGNPDAITQLKLIAEKSPEPIKHWLSKISNESWKLLMKESGQYLDISWQNQVYHYYQVEIANRYPFNSSSPEEINMQNFIQFFGNPGIVMNYYNNYLQNFVDASTADWHWKKMDGKQVPFSEETLRQIQQAMRIHDSFFPNNDDKPYIEFNLKPYEFSKSIQNVKVNISNNQFTDANNENKKNTHIITWPSKKDDTTFIQLTLANQEIITRKYPGNWGWFKLIYQSFESMISKKELLINLSFNNEHPVKYILASNGKYNPYLSYNLQHFHLPSQLLDEND